MKPFTQPSMATIYPALCRGCRKAPAQAYKDRRNGRWYLRRCRDCAMQDVRDSRARMRTVSDAWRQRIDNEWRAGS